MWDFAVELVRRGMVVAAPELLGFGDRRYPEDKAIGPKQSSCLRLAVHLLMLGRTLAGQEYSKRNGSSTICSPEAMSPHRRSAVWASPEAGLSRDLPPPSMSV